MTIVATLDIVAQSALTTHIADIDSIVNFRCSSRRNMPGNPFELEVAYDASCLSDLIAGRIIRLKLNGTVAYTGVLVEIVNKEVEGGEESEQNIVWRGQPYGSVLNRLRARSQFPAGKKPWSKTRSFNFGCKEFDVSGWPTATIIFAGWDKGSASAHWKLEPAGFPDFGADWIGPSDGTDVTAPLGDCYYVADPSGTGTGLFHLGADTGLAFFEGADNNGPFLFDGLSLLNIDQFDTTQFTATHNATAYGSAGDHRYAAKISNPSGIDNTQNPTGLIAACFATDGSGALGALQWHTDATFRILKRPVTPPGFTIGQIARILIQENQFETIGVHEITSFGFSDTLDSALNAWDTIENVTVNVGDSLLKILGDWSQLYCTWSISASGVLNLYRLDATPVASGVSYGLNALPSLSTLEQFESDTVDIGTDVLLVGWNDGFVRVPSFGGTRMDFLSTNAETVEQAVIIGTRTLAQQGQLAQLTTKIQPTGTGDVPGVDWVLGNTIVLVPPSGTRTAVVEAWDCTITDDDPEFGVTVSAVLPDSDERTRLWLQRMAAGAGAGTAPGSISGPAPQFQSQNSLSAFTFNFPDPLVTGLLAKDNKLTAAANAYAWELLLQTAGTSNTTVELLINGSVIATCTLGSGITQAVVQVVGLVTPLTQRVLPTDLLQANCTAVGSGAAGLIGKPWFI